MHELEAFYRSADELAALDREIPVEVWYRRLAADLAAPDKEKTNAVLQRYFTTLDALAAHGLAAADIAETVPAFLDRSSG